MKRLLRAALEGVVRLYYPVLDAEGLDALGADRAYLFVLNHPNGLLDPVVLRIALRRPVAFLAKSTLFGNPVGRAAMATFDAIPVRRAKESDGAGADRNEETFARCRDALARGISVALFPEGTSHSDPSLKRLKTGAARIALSAELEQHRALQVVPVGLFYEAKATFRSRVLLSAGVPVDVAPFAAQGDGPEAVDAVTTALREALDAVVLQADTRALLEGIARVARWTAPTPGASADLATSRRRASDLLRRHRALVADDPARAAALVEAGRRYVSAMEHLGVRDAWALEPGAERASVVATSAAGLVVLAPLALAGAVLGWPMYRLAGVVAGRAAREEDVRGTAKLLAGLVFVPAGWFASAAVVSALVGLRAGLACFVLAATGGWAALRWEELAVGAAHALRSAWLRRRHPEVAAAMVAKRRELADALASALHDETAQREG